MNKMNTLAELVKFGIKAATEDDLYYYILPDDPNRGYYDQSFYRYDKKTGKLEWSPSMLDFIPQIDNSVPVQDLSIFETLI